MHTTNNTIQNAKPAERRALEMAALLSHQIRSPLYTIRNAVSQMNEECEHCTDQCQAFIAIIDRSTDRIVALVERCLRLMELEEKRNTPETMQIQPMIDLEDLIFRIVSSLTEENELCQRRIQVQIDQKISKPAAVRVDAFLLEQALANLIANALQYGCIPSRQETPTVIVRLEYAQEQEYFQIEVQDWGPGITPEEQSLIFLPFYRVASSTLLRKSGSGLGLAIVKTIIESFNGQVGVTSAPGLGSTFWFTLPILSTVI